MDKGKIRYLVMDVDGTLTDGKIYMGPEGELCKAFHVRDGLGIRELAVREGILPVILTGRRSDILRCRCRELGIELVFQGAEHKEETLGLITDRLWQIAYIGDDINDLAAMKLVKKAGGLTGCPADAVRAVRKTADYVSDRGGGEGAVRDFIEWILEKNGEDP